MLDSSSSRNSNEREYTIVSLDSLKPFSGVLYDEKGNKTGIEGNPFYVPDNYLNKDDKNNKNDKDHEEMRMLHASIEQEGVLTPLLVRPSRDNKIGAGQTGEQTYEILSGYRRKRVCDELAKTQPKFKEVPVLVVDCDDDDASSIITSANVQRREVSLLDTIISCGRMYRALRHRGAKSDKDLTIRIVANVLGLTPRSVARYSLLLDLPEFMLRLIGQKTKTCDGNIRLSIRAGEALYGMNKDKVDIVNQIMQSDDSVVVTHETAMKLKKSYKKNPEITKEEIEQIIREAVPIHNGKATTPKRRFSLNGNLMETINTYCHDMSEQEIEDLLSELLTKWGDSANIIKKSPIESLISQ